MPRRAALLLAATALIAGPVAATAPGAAAAPVLTPTAWTAVLPACAQPTDPTAIRCFAQKVVPVPAGTAGAVRRTAVGHGPAGGYSPTDLAKAYGYNPKAKVHQTVAVVDWYDDPYALADLNHFDRHYGMPTETAKTFAKVNQSGHATPLPKPSRSSATEIALDVEAVRAVCRRCKILLVEAKSASSANLATAIDTAVRLGATEVSNSWGGPDGHVSATLKAAVKHPGVVITAADGDGGWLGWGYGEHAASFPSSSNYVVAVGGTTLKLTSTGARKSETAWYSATGATGGGCSTHFVAPGWQTHATGYSALGCSGKRSAADVSVLANPTYGLSTYDRYGTPLYVRACSTKHATSACWGRTGGTSLGAPVVAAMYALRGGSGGSAYPAASLYVNAALKPGTRYDVTAGGNSYCAGASAATCARRASNDSAGATNNPNVLADDQGGPRVDCTFPHYARTVDVTKYATLNPGCNAAQGLDGPTGLGTPKGLGLFTDTSPGAAIAGHTTVRHGVRHSYAVHFKTVVSGTKITAVSWNFGDGQALSGTARTVTHTYRHPGKYRITMTARDSRYQRVVRHMVVTVK